MTKSKSVTLGKKVTLVTCLVTTYRQKKVTLKKSNFVQCSPLIGLVSVPKNIILGVSVPTNIILGVNVPINIILGGSVPKNINQEVDQVSQDLEFYVFGYTNP